MVAALQRVPIRAFKAGFYRFSVEDYHELTRLGILTEDDNVELLDGHLVQKNGHNPPHDGTLRKAEKKLGKQIPEGWDLRCQLSLNLSTSVPEPDLLVVQGDETTYMNEHPGPSDVGLVIEVSDSSLDSDREDKARISYDSLPEYWIVNIPDRQVEVYTQPSGPMDDPSYAVCTVFTAGQLVPFSLEGQLLASFLVEDLLP